MSDNPEENAETEYTDDQNIAYTQQLRRQILTDVTKDGLPKDKESIDLVLEAARDIDRTALGNKRIQSGDRNSDSNHRVAMAVQQLQRSLGNANPFEVGPDGQDPAIDQARFNDDLLPDIEVKPGEMDVGHHEETYKEFMARMDDEVSYDDVDDADV